MSGPSTSPVGPALPTSSGERSISCASLDLIERHAAGEPLPAEIAAHVGECPTCQEHLASARDDQKFLTRARSLTAGTLSPEGTPRIAGYGHLRVLSQGAQGTVYHAVQESTSREVAIKVLTRAGGLGSSRQQARAEREAETAARLRHANIVTVYESRTLSDGRKAVVMEYVDGCPIDQWRSPAATESERQRGVLRVFIDVCSAIHHAHLNGVIHRDLKPDNILVASSDEGQKPRPVVLDFGIAKAGGIQATITGDFAGTPAYASPEQVAGKPEDVDALTDVYSLGVVAYRLLCGAMPYEVGGSIFEIARTITEVEPLPPRTHVPGLATDLDSIIRRALRKEKALRYQSAAALAQDVERYLAGEPVEARSGSGWYLLRKAVLVNRRKLAWVVALVAVLMGAAASVLVSLSNAARSAADAAAQQRSAQQESTRARAVTELLRTVLPNSDPARPELDRIAGQGFSRLYLRLETGAFASDPELDQALRRLWGGVYTGLGQGKAADMVEYAEVSLRNGLVRLRTEHGSEHPAVASTMHELAGVLLVRKRYPEAEDVCRQALAMRERLARGAKLQSTAETRALLAKVLQGGGKPEDAVREADAALAEYAALPGEVDIPVAAMLALKARVKLNSDAPSEAEPLLRDALVRRLSHLPPEDADLNTSLADVADLIERCPDCELAKVMAEVWPATGTATVAARVRDDLPRLRSFGASLPFEATTQQKTGALLNLVALQEQLLGRDDVALVGTLIAIVRAAEGDREPTIKSDAALRAAGILEKTFGPNDFAVLICIEEAASTMGFSGRAAEAVPLERRALAIWATVPEHARDPLLIANEQRYLAWFLALAGEYEQSISEHQSTIERLIEAVGPRHHTITLSRAIVGYCHGQLGRLDEADRLTAAALDEIKSLPALPRDVRTNLNFLRGHVLRKLGRHAESIALLAPLWEPDIRALQPEFQWRREYLDDMVANCRALGDAAGVEWWQAAGRPGQSGK